MLSSTQLTLQARAYFSCSIITQSELLFLFVRCDKLPEAQRVVLCFDSRSVTNTFLSPVLWLFMFSHWEFPAKALYRNVNV